MSTQTTTAFNARAAVGFFSEERLFRVYFAPGGLFFIRVGGARHDMLAVQFGLLGLLISNLTMKGRMKKVQEKMADMDQSSLRDRIEDHKDNFREPFTAIVSSTITPASMFLFTEQGGHKGRWKVAFENRRTMRFQFDTVEDMRTAVEELPKVLGEKHVNQVAWSDKKQRYVKKRD
jgi:hypothetical protein